MDTNTRQILCLILVLIFGMTVTAPAVTCGNSCCCDRIKTAHCKDLIQKQCALVCNCCASPCQPDGVENIALSSVSIWDFEYKNAKKNYTKAAFSDIIPSGKPEKTGMVLCHPVKVKSPPIFLLTQSLLC